MKSYKDWQNARQIERSELEFSKPFDVFIYTRISIKHLVGVESEQLHFSDNISQAINYIRYIFLFDILNDISDDLQYDFEMLSEEKQSDIISIMNYWFKCGQIFKQNNDKDFLRLCEKFNLEFSQRESTEYEINIFTGANALRDFLISRYASNVDFDKYKLECICSNDVFSGKLLQEFIDNLFNT